MVNAMVAMLCLAELDSKDCLSNLGHNNLHDSDNYDYSASHAQL